jgi:hypothetical protein
MCRTRSQIPFWNARLEDDLQRHTTTPKAADFEESHDALEIDAQEEDDENITGVMLDIFLDLLQEECNDSDRSGGQISFPQTLDLMPIKNRDIITVVFHHWPNWELIMT